MPRAKTTEIKKITEAKYAMSPLSLVFCLKSGSLVEEAKGPLGIKDD